MRVRKQGDRVRRRRGGIPASLTALVVLAIVGVAGGLLVARNMADKGTQVDLSPDSPWTLLASRPMIPVTDARSDGASILIERHGMADKNAIAAAAATIFEQGKTDPLVDGKPQASPPAQAMLLQVSGPDSSKSGAGGSRIGAKVTTGNVAMSVVRLDVPGRETPLYVRKMRLGAETVLTAEPGTGTPYLHRSPGGMQYVLASDGQLILIDARTLTATNLTPDVIDGFDRWALWRKGNDAGKAIVWADNPVWSGDGAKVYYVSDRKSIQDDVAGSAAEIWSVDVKTCKHQVVNQGQHFRQLLGCYGDALAFAELDGVACLSLSTGAVRTIAGSGRVVGESAPAPEQAEGSAPVVVTVPGYLTAPVATVTDVSVDQAKSVALRAPEGTAFVRVAASPARKTLAAVVRDGRGRDAIALYSKDTSGGAGVSNSTLTPTAVLALPDPFLCSNGEQFVSDEFLVVNVSSVSGGQIKEAAYLLSTTAGGAAKGMANESPGDGARAYRPVSYSGPYYPEAAYGDSASAVLSEFSPLREGNPANEAFPPVTSKFNQPRHVGITNTNPHQGSDVNSVAADVYAPWNGWIAGRTSTAISVRIDADSDGTPDDSLIVTYDHLRNITTLPIGSAVSYTDVIAQIDGSLLCPHLHFGNRTTLSGGANPDWVKNEPFFRGSGGWNAGRDLDLVSRTTVFGGKVIAYVYVKDEGRTVQIDEGDVRIFYRLAGTGPNGAWTEAPMVKETPTLFSFDLAKRTGDKQVDFLIRVERSEQKAAHPDDYYWAFDPPKQLRPNPDPGLQGDPGYYTANLGR